MEGVANAMGLSLKVGTCGGSSDGQTLEMEESFGLKNNRHTI